jgi:hypothetical protein
MTPSKIPVPQSRIDIAAQLSLISRRLKAISDQIFAEAERGLPASLQPVLDIGECGKETMVVFVVACQGLDPIQKREIASATYSVQ